MHDEEFRAMYAARFRPLTPQDGLKEWAAMVAEADAGIMRQALDAIVDHHRRLSEDSGRTIGAPRLGEVGAAYRRLAKDGVKHWHEYDVETCPRCGNSGWGFGVTDGKGRWLDPKNPKPMAAPTYITVIPCACKHGDATGPRPDKLYPPEFKQALSRYILGPCGRPVDKADGRCLGTVRDWQGVAEKAAKEAVV